MPKLSCLSCISSKTDEPMDTGRPLSRSSARAKRPITRQPSPEYTRRNKRSGSYDGTERKRTKSSDQMSPKDTGSQSTQFPDLPSSANKTSVKQAPGYELYPPSGSRNVVEARSRGLQAGPRGQARDDVPRMYGLQASPGTRRRRMGDDVSAHSSLQASPAAREPQMVYNPSKYSSSQAPSTTRERRIDDNISALSRSKAPPATGERVMGEHVSGNSKLQASPRMDRMRDHSLEQSKLQGSPPTLGRLVTDNVSVSNPSQQGSLSGSQIHPSVQPTPPRDLSAEFRRIMAENAQLKEENAKLQADYHNFQKMLAQYSEVIEKLHADKRRLNKENIDSVNELTQSLTDQNCAYQSQLHDAKEENERLQGEREKIQKTLRAVIRERDNVIQVCKTKHDLLKDERDSLKYERDSLKDERDSLQQENIRIHEHYSSLTEMTDLSTMAKRQDEIKRLQVDNENLKQQCEEELTKAVAMAHERESLVNEVTGLTAKNNELSNEATQKAKAADELRSKLEYTEQNNIKLRQQIEYLMGENRKLTLERQEHADIAINYQKLKQECQIQTKTLKNVLSEKEIDDNALSEFKRKHDCEIEKYTNTLQQVYREAEDNRGHLYEVRTKHQMLQLEIEDERKKNEKFALKIQEKDKQLAAMEQEQKATLKQHEKTEQFYKDKMRKKEEELRRMSLRVSELVAEAVGRNNPFMEDLGSQNRSMKIAERFTTDLYGNAWCDALDALGDEGVSEKDAVEAICHTLVEVFEFCRDHFEKVVKTASTWLVSLDSMGDNSQADIQVPGGSLRHLQNAMKDFLKATALSLTADKLLQLYYRDVADAGSDRVRTQQPLISFIKQALTICWCMATQDPPMSLHYQLQPGDAFEPTSFKPYRQPGSRVQSLVWPALLLTEGGHVMEKGVVMLTDM